MIKNTVVFDYGNKPSLGEHASKFERMIVSPRVDEDEGYAAILNELGDRVSAWVQPFAATYDGKDVDAWVWDRQLWQIANSRFGLLRDWEGRGVGVQGSDISGAYVLGLGNPDIAQRFHDLIESLSIKGPILFDYATWDLRWEQSLAGVLDRDWMQWAYNWFKIRDAFPNAFMQNNKPAMYSPLMLEKCGWSLNPVGDVFNIVSASELKNIVVCDDEGSDLRHDTAAIAIMCDQYFSWKRNDIGPEMEWANDQEWHDEAPWQDGRSGLWVRRCKRGYVLFNNSAVQRNYKLTRVVDPWCGLVFDYANGRVA